jgi:curved DNA-binding protein CbpA
VLSDSSFIDYYEQLQVSPNADTETISRVFRHLAKRHHPDNLLTGNRETFEQLALAHHTLIDPERRAAYDVRYQEGRAHHLSLAREVDGDVIDDTVVRERILSVLYAQRRRDAAEPSMGNVEMERLLSCPREYIDFHLWYLKEKRWVERTDRGFAITALGVDQVEASKAASSHARLLADRANGGTQKPGLTPEL